MAFLGLCSFFLPAHCSFSFVAAWSMYYCYPTPVRSIAADESHFWCQSTREKWKSKRKWGDRLSSLPFSRFLVFFCLFGSFACFCLQDHASFSHRFIIFVIGSNNAGFVVACSCIDRRIGASVGASYLVIYASASNGLHILLKVRSICICILTPLCLFYCFHFEIHSYRCCKQVVEAEWVPSHH